MKNKSGEDRRININNIFSFNRLGFSDEVESGQSLTIGADHLINKIVYDEENLPYSKHFIDLSLATVFRDEINEDIPASSSLGNKSSDVVGKIGFSPNSFFNTTYNFSVDNNIEQFKYHDIAAKFTVNNFVTSFKYIEEKDVIGDAHYYTNITEYNFNENNSFYFETRRNKKIDMTEFYDLIYQYKNDCLIASLKYNKKFYNDSDILPSEQLFFTITVVPLGAYDSNDLIRNK